MNLPTYLKTLLNGKDDVPLTEEAVAKKLGVAKASVCNWITGKEPCPEHQLARIVEAFVNGDDKAKRLEFLRLYLLLGVHRAENPKPGKDPAHSRWEVKTQELVIQALRECYDDTTRRLESRRGGSRRTLADFPEAFMPLAVVTGDKREDSRTRITAADFGALSASPAEARWLPSMKFPEQVELFSDKLFVLEDYDQLCRRFSETHLLVIGSPASNHLARRLHISRPRSWPVKATPIFRFNLDQNSLEGVEALLPDLLKENPAQLVGRQGDPNTAGALRFWCQSLFHGGIIDPTYFNPPVWVRAINVDRARDFGLISIALNPFSHPKRPFFCILAAGTHMFGTAHAVRFLGQPQKFHDHPYGGVLRVDVNLNEPFTHRFDNSQAEWDTDSEYDREKLESGLKKLMNEVPVHVKIDKDEASQCSLMLDAL